MTGTYINPQFMNGTIGRHIITYGIGKNVPGAERRYQRYYQWVAPVLVLQALIFYLPHMLWKSWEDSKVTYLCNNIGSTAKLLFLISQY